MNEKDSKAIHELFSEFHYSDNLGLLKSKLVDYVTNVRREERHPAVSAALGDEWLPIESAPKGIDILLLWEDQHMQIHRFPLVERPSFWFENAPIKWRHLPPLPNAAATTSSPAAQPNPLCLLCGHNGVAPDGTCMAPVPICGNEYHGTRRCGCVCRFPAAAVEAGGDEHRITPEVAAKLIHLRDTLGQMESSELVNEAWHTLYSIADPEIASFYPWAELERLAALRNPEGEGK